MATIVDIARETGLARTTVAEVLRGKPGYSDQSRARVQAAAKRLGYRPNYLSKALSGGKSMTVGVLLPTHATPIVNEWVVAVERAARAAGYLTYLTVWGGEHEISGDPVQLIDDLLQRRVDGLVLYYEGLSEVPLERLFASEVPSVLFPAGPASLSSLVRVDYPAAYGALAEHLRTLGHRQAAMLVSPFHARHPEIQLSTARQTLAEAGIELIDAKRWLLPEGARTSVDSYRFMKARLAAGDRLPTVVLANNDQGGLGVLAALHEAGIKVPQQVSVVGFDDLPIAATGIPPLTTIRLPGVEVGERAFGLLLKRMRDPGAVVEPVTFRTELVVRDSTGPASPMV